jgi:hypothetical protein
MSNFTPVFLIVHVNPTQNINPEAVLALAAELGWDTNVNTLNYIQRPGKIELTNYKGDSFSVSPLELKSPDYRCYYRLGEWLNIDSIPAKATAALNLEPEELDWSKTTAHGNKPIGSMPELVELMESLHGNLPNSLIRKNGLWDISGMDKNHNPGCFGFPKLNMTDAEHLLFVSSKMSKEGNVYFVVDGTTYDEGYQVHLKSSGFKTVTKLSSNGVFGGKA